MNIHLDTLSYIKKYVSKALSPFNMGNEEYLLNA